MQGGKRADVDSPEVLGVRVTPFSFDGLLLVFREGHSKLAGDLWDE
jgi:hypothetical protein